MRRGMIFLRWHGRSNGARRGQAAAPSSAANGAASVPNFSGVWATHPSPASSPLAPAPTSLRNLSRRGVTSDNRQLVGDYRNPILSPRRRTS